MNNSSNPLSFLDDLNQITSFRQKIQFIDRHLEKIASDSGRAVYNVDNQKILKLAKNPKGQAQNESEVNISTDIYSDDIVTEVFQYDENNYDWIISEKAKKVSPKRIVELTGIPDLHSLDIYLRNFQIGGFRIPEDIKENLDNNEWVQRLLELVGNFNLDVGDFGRPSSFGEVNRNGQPEIVITDYGLTHEVYQTHYASKRTGNRMYEMIDFNVGGIRQEFTDGREVRRGFALQPYSVSDGNDVVNEQFINFVENKSDYLIKKPIFNLWALGEEFEKSIRNLNEYIKNSHSPSKFVNNLSKLQEYLNECGYSIKEEFLLEQDVDVEPFTLTREMADKISTYTAKEIGTITPSFIGEGSYGYAYRVGDKVLKITSDISEVNSSLNLLRCKPETIVNINNVFKVIDNDTNKAFFVILQEYVENRPTSRFVDLMMKFNEKLTEYSLDQTGDDDELFRKFYKIHKKSEFNFDEYVNFVKDIIYAPSKVNYSDQTKKEIFDFIVGMGKIKRDLIGCNILKGSDYLTLSNLGLKDGNLVFFDVGGYVAQQPQLPPESIMRMNEMEGHNVDLNIINNYIGDIANKLNLGQPIYLDSGSNGHAFSVGDKVLKITTDKSEAVESLNLLSKTNQYVADIYGVFKINPKDESSKLNGLYVIVLEKLKTSPEILSQLTRKFNRLKFVFSKIFNLDVYDVFDFYGMDKYEDHNEKIDLYMNKNPQDAEFFNQLKNIREEIYSTGNISVDFMNPKNLGYKKDGKLGFFDIGFGNTEFKNEPKKLEIGEDLEYSHVNNGTKDEYYLGEERIKSYMPKSQEVSVKDKCKLDGLGNTSVACNQGEMRNFNLKEI
jgi:serine/threonine protein kinase